MSLPSALPSPATAPPAGALKIRIKLAGLQKPITASTPEEPASPASQDPEVTAAKAVSAPKKKALAKKRKRDNIQEGTTINQQQSFDEMVLESTPDPMDFTQRLDDPFNKRPRGRPKRPTDMPYSNGGADGGSSTPIEQLSSEPPPPPLPVTEERNILSNSGNSTATTTPIPTPNNNAVVATTAATTTTTSSNSTRLIGYRSGGRAYNPVTDWHEQPVLEAPVKKEANVEKKWEKQLVLIKTLVGEMQISTWKPTGTFAKIKAAEMNGMENGLSGVIGEGSGVKEEDANAGNDTTMEPPAVATTAKEVKKLHACDRIGCKRAFSDPSGLARHITVSHGPRRFHCKFPGCFRRFNDAGKLKRHMGAHEKLYFNGTNATTEAEIN